MPEEKKDTDNKPEDVVKREDYNKAIEAQNSLKVDKEKAEKELKDIRFVINDLALTFERGGY